MKEGAAYQAASAGQQTVESSGGHNVPGFGDPSVEKEKTRAKKAAGGLTFSSTR